MVENSALKYIVNIRAALSDINMLAENGEFAENTI
jgi:hypothetical protein